MSAAPPARPRRSPSTKKHFFVGRSESVRRRWRARRRAFRCRVTLFNANQQSPATSAAATHPNSSLRFSSLPRRRTRRLPNSSGALLAKTTQSNGRALQHIKIADAADAPPQSSSSLDFFFDFGIIVSAKNLFWRGAAEHRYRSPRIECGGHRCASFTGYASFGRPRIFRTRAALSGAFFWRQRRGAKRRAPAAKLGMGNTHMGCFSNQIKVEESEVFSPYLT